MDTLYRAYVWIFEDLADKRVEGWPMMDSPGPFLMVLATYLYVIKVALPWYMKDRPPYDLKSVIRWFNVFQIITNAVLFYGILTSGWLTTITFGCHLPDYESKDPESERLLVWMYRTFMFRAVDMLETTFFILRKKDKQASFLHIYHHCISYSMMWMAVKYIGGGGASISMLLNNPVHVIMYTYYLIAAEAGPKLRAKMNRWKMGLTVIQMAQFTILFIHSLQAFLPSCPAPQVIVWIYMPNVVLIYYLFYQFFKKTYMSRKPLAKDAKTKNDVHKNGIGADKRKVA